MNEGEQCGGRDWAWRFVCIHVFRCPFANSAPSPSQPVSSSVPTSLLMGYDGGCLRTSFSVRVFDRPHCLVQAATCLPCGPPGGPGSSAARNREDVIESSPVPKLVCSVEENLPCRDPTAGRLAAPIVRWVRGLRRGGRS